MWSLHLNANRTQARVASDLRKRIEQFAQATRTTLPRGRAGGLAHTRTAWHHFDGTFMPESEKEAAYFEGYERYARGGRAHASDALRYLRGRFLPSERL